MKRSTQDFVNTSKYKNSVQQLNEDSIEFSLSTWIRRVSKSSQAKLLYHQSYFSPEESVL